MYPPILESQRHSIPAGTPTAQGLRINMQLPRTIPRDANGRLIIGHIQVLIRRQLTLESLAQPQLVSSPDRETVYLDPREQIDGTLAPLSLNSNTLLFNVSGDFATLDLLPRHIRDFSAGEDNEGQIYTIQIRFGINSITEWRGNAANFAAWRTSQVAASAFGEWSNTQRVFVFAGNRATIFPEPSISTDIVAGFSWRYAPVSNDPLAQVRLHYSYFAPDGRLFTVNKDVPFVSEPGEKSGRWGAGGTVEIGVARLLEIKCFLTYITINNTVAVREVTIPVLEQVESIGTVYPRRLIGDENEDGVIIIEFAVSPPEPEPPPAPLPPPMLEDEGEEEDEPGDEYEDDVPGDDNGEEGEEEDDPGDGDGEPYGGDDGPGDGPNGEPGGEEDTRYSRFFRINLPSFEIIQIGASEREENGLGAILRDYTIEMGGRYAYIGVIYDNYGQGEIVSSIGDFSSLFYLPPLSWNPRTYTGLARNMSFGGISFLTTKLNQLRLQGNVTVRNFNRVVNDQITQTIGGKYPFVARTGQSDHRTMTVSALISLNFDPTRTFLNLDTTQRQNWWDGNLTIRREEVNQYSIVPGIPGVDDEVIITKDIAKETIIENEDLFPIGKYSNNVRRLLEREKEDAIITNTAITNEPVSNDPFDPKRGAPNTFEGPATIYDSNFGQDVFPAETLSDSSELIYVERRFREEVMKWLTDGKPKLFRSETEGNMIVVLTGVSFSPFGNTRLNYSFSATLTEIAEYNLKNLILYNLVPSDFQGVFTETNEFIAGYGSVPPTISQKQYRFFDSGMEDPVAFRVLNPS